MLSATIATVVQSAAAATHKPVIDWGGFIIVAVVTLVGSGFVVCMYSLGVRFTAVSGDEETRFKRLTKWGSWVCFGFCVLAVAAGIILIVPAFYSTAARLFGFAA